MADEQKPKQEVISIIVRDQQGNTAFASEVTFKVKPTTKFSKIIDAYCAKKAIDSSTIRFMFDGNRIQKDSTPQELEMEDSDIVDALVEQIGGAVCCSPVSSSSSWHF
eukprot:gene27020-2247_t